MDVETVGKYTAGTTSVDLWGYRDEELKFGKGKGNDEEGRESWGREGRNVWVAESVEVQEFWGLFLQVSLRVGELREGRECAC